MQTGSPYLSRLFGCFAVLLAMETIAPPHAGSARPRPETPFTFTTMDRAWRPCHAASEEQQKDALDLADKALLHQLHPMAHVEIDGLLPGEGIRDASEEAELDWTAARDLAVGYCITGSRAYYAKAASIFQAWLPVYQPSFNPVDEAKIEQLFLAADLLRLRDFSAPTPRGLAPFSWQSFAGVLTQGYLRRIDENVSHPDLRQSGRIQLAAMGAFTSADARGIAQVEADYLAQLNANIRPDGEVTDFTQHDALRSVVDDLQPLVVAALVAHNHGRIWQGLQAPRGSTIGCALRWLGPYASGDNTHREFLYSQDSFDFARLNAGEPGFSGDWDPAGSANLYAFASALDVKWADLAAQLNAPPPLWQQIEMGLP